MENLLFLGVPILKHIRVSIAVLQNLSILRYFVDAIKLWNGIA